MYWEKEGAEKGQEYFDLVFRKSKIPKNIPEVVISEKKINILNLLVKTKSCPSKSGARKMVEQGAVKINQEIIRDWKSVISELNNKIVQVGKRKFTKIKSE